jgi:sialate O-acetylesterase
MRTLAAVLILLLAGARPSTRAELKLHALFGDHMVLQQGIAAPVWGTAAPGEEIAVAIADQKKTAKAGADGRWIVKLDPLKAGGPLELTVSGKTTVTLKDVLVGEVWIASGQSNMQWSVKASANPDAEIAAASHPKLRLFYVPRVPAAEPARDVNAKWELCTPETVGNFSAVAYFFGRELQKSVDVPIGLIHTSWGGTAAELWTSRRVLGSHEGLKDVLPAYDKRKASHEAAVEKFKADAEKAKAEGKPAPKAPNNYMDASCLYNGMIAPLIPYGIKGAIWYQGESNAGNAKGYQTLFPAMIRNWRDDWGQGEFPFLFVQLANYMARKTEPGESNWAELREAQTKTLALPKTGMAVIIDIGDAKDIHPKNKQDVGKRLALWAQAQVYGKDVVYSGPLFDACKVEGDKARISFKHAGSGLEAKGEKLAGFAVAGEDRKFVWADAKIEGKEVVVSSPQVAKPAAVRYAWADNPECTLYNKEGLPASPFRTDDWPKAAAK